jgi:hypothetical protein
MIDQADKGFTALTTSEKLPEYVSIILMFPAIIYAGIVCWPIGVLLEWRENKQNGIRTVRD